MFHVGEGGGGGVMVSWGSTFNPLRFKSKHCDHHFHDCISGSPSKLFWFQSKSSTSQAA